MTFRISVVAPHPLVADILERLLSETPELNRLLLPPKTDFPSHPRRGEKYIFILDAPSLTMPISRLARSLRIRCPGCKFLVLVGSKESDEEILRLLYNGKEGILRMGDNMRTELPKAIRALLSGKLWAPNNVLTDYVSQTNLLFDKQVLSQLSLTGRESQVLQLMIRRLCNKEIAGALGISERTVRFHVSNIFKKLHVVDRRSLLGVFEKLKHKPA